MNNNKIWQVRAEGQHISVDIGEVLMVIKEGPNSGV